MSITNIVLLGLLVLLLCVLSPNLRRLAAVGICLWLWIICLVFSGMAGVFGGGWIATIMLPDNAGATAGFYIPRTVLALPFTLPVAAVLTFLVSYRFAAFGLISLIERKQKVQLARPSVKLGVIVAAISPFIVWFILSAFKKGG